MELTVRKMTVTMQNIMKKYTEGKAHLSIGNYENLKIEVIKFIIHTNIHQIDNYILEVEL